MEFNWIVRVDAFMNNAHASKAGAISLDNGASLLPDLFNPQAIKLPPELAQKIADCFKSMDFSPFNDGIIVIDHEVYRITSQTDDRIYLAQEPKYNSMIMRKSKTAIIIARSFERDFSQARPGKEIDLQMDKFIAYLISKGL